jgi:CRISPR system Cascade subunit CasD
MQSWGTQSRFGERDTGLEPSKSGVIGLVCAAMGVPRDDDAALAELAALWMGVRVDREGLLQRDYHTAGGGKWPGLERYGVSKSDGSSPATVVSNRFYLADAVFLVTLAGLEPVLREIERALHDPVWPLFLGRKAFPPSESIWLSDCIDGGRPEDVLKKRRALAAVRSTDQMNLRLVLECGPGKGQRRFDQPISYALGRRRHGVRYVSSDSVNRQDLDQGGGV